MKWVYKTFLFFIAGGVIFSSAFVFSKKKRRKVYTVDFQDEFIEGHVKNPTIFHLFNKQELEYGRLVDLKENFLPEMRRTAGEIE